MTSFFSITALLAGISLCAAAMTNEELRNWILEREVKLYRFTNYQSDGYRNNRVDHSISRICNKNTAPMERSVGYVVYNTDFEEKLKSECPDLTPMYIHYGGPNSKNGTWMNTLLDMQTAGIKRIGMFYCAKNAGYCGANQPLYETKTHVNAAPLYTDDMRHGQSSGLGMLVRCHIWVPEPSVENTNGTLLRRILMERGSSLYKLEHLEANKNNRITTSYDELWQDVMPQQVFTRVGMVAYVVKECDAEEALQMCPELQKMDIYQSKVGSWLSHIAKAGEKPAGALGTLGSTLCPSPSFYCAPRRGYCGADKPIYSIDTVEANVNVKYPIDENDMDSYLCKDEKYKKTFTRHCFGWAEDTYFRKFVNV